MDESTSRSTNFCLVCVVDAIETDQLSRIRELLSTPEEFDDAVALAVDGNGFRHDDVQFMTAAGVQVLNPAPESLLGQRCPHRSPGRLN